MSRQNRPLGLRAALLHRGEIHPGDRQEAGAEGDPDEIPAPAGSARPPALGARTTVAARVRAELDQRTADGAAAVPGHDIISVAGRAANAVRGARPPCADRHVRIPWPWLRLGIAALVWLIFGATSPAAASEPGDVAVQRFYALRGNAPAWMETDQAQAALTLLENAADDGLEPADYGVAALRELLARSRPGTHEGERADAALSGAVLRYLGDLHAGRTRGVVLSYEPATAPAFDPAAALQAALGAGKVAGLRDEAAPALLIYARLRTALRHYRALAAQGDTAVVLSNGQALAEGDAYAGAPALRRRLVELGELETGPASSPEHYGTDLAEAIRRFQRRHGLRDDGVLGPATLAALNVPLRQRVRQIALAMERLRWLPPLPAGRVVAVNLPSFRLWALDRRRQESQPMLDMRVIVGKAAGTPTPVFIGVMRHLEFNPYWNVPPSILRNELLPRIARDPGYLRRHDMEVVAGGGVKSGAAVVAGLRSGALRVRQRPGPANALGPLKFALPNAMNIYLHGTPARELFGAPRRDFSHGCIRVEDPAALAQFVLADPQRWDAAAVARAMAPGPMRIVRLDVPVPVVIFYTTAIAERDGTVTFLEDVYGLDRKLASRWDAMRR